MIEYICNCYVFAGVKLNLPCTKAFMDDLFLQSSSVSNTEFLLQRCTCVLSWARLSFRASKSRSIVIRNGKVLDVSPFSFDNEVIPSIHSNPVKFHSSYFSFIKSLTRVTTPICAIDAMHVMQLKTVSAFN